jgi:uncharacterized protein YkwD
MDRRARRLRSDTKSVGRACAIALVAAATALAGCSGWAPTAPDPVTISAQPHSQTIAPGGFVTLSVVAAGAPPISYQWYVGSTGTTSAPITGATSPSYTTPALTITTRYWVRISNAGATADSDTATVTVSSAPAPDEAPAISAQPQPQIVASGQTATLTVAATGTGPLSYQWYLGASATTSDPIAGATTGSYTTPPLTSTTSYWVRVWNTAGSANSATVTVTVSPPAGVGPTIATPPQSQTIAAGQSAALSVVATGTAPLAYQWFTGGSGDAASPIAGAAASGYTTPALSSTTSYWVRVSNAYGTADSAAATITIAPPAGIAPAITTQPQSQTVASGQTATLVVGVSGTAPLSYQWYVGSSGATDTPIAGATGPSYTTPALTASTSYWVRVSNASGTTSSATATIAVNTGGSSAFEDEVLVIVNQRRAAGAICGGSSHPPVSPLAMNANLRNAARGHSVDMAANNFLSHTGSDGRTAAQRIAASGYAGSYPWGENIAGGQPTPQAAVDAWMTSPGHCAAIMSGSFKAVGVGYAYSASSTYGHYWTQDFGGS